MKTNEDKSGLSMTHPRCHPRKSIKKRLSRAMEIPPNGKAAYADIARANSK